MILTTTNSIEGHPIQDYLGIVSGVSMSYQKGTLTLSMSKYFQAVEEQLDSLKEEAFQKLKTNAANLKANAVVGINTDVEVDSSGGSITVSVVGTAVLCKN